MDWADTIIFVIGYGGIVSAVAAIVLAARKENWDPPPVDEVLSHCRHRRIRRLRRRAEKLDAASIKNDMAKAERKNSEVTKTLRDTADEVLPDVEAAKPVVHPNESWPERIYDTPVQVGDTRLGPNDAEMMWMAYDEKSKPQRIPPRIRTPYSGTFPINIVGADGRLQAQRVKFGWDVRIHHDVSSGIIFKVRCNVDHGKIPREVNATVPAKEIPMLLDGRMQQEQREMLCRLCSKEFDGQIIIQPVDKPHPSELSWHPTGSVFEFHHRRSRMVDMTIVPKMDSISFVYEFDAISSKKGRVRVRYDTENKGRVDWQGGVGCADVNLTIQADREAVEWKKNYSVVLSILFMAGDKERLSNMIIWTQRAYNVNEDFGDLDPIEISDIDN